MEFTYWKQKREIESKVKPVIEEITVDNVAENQVQSESAEVVASVNEPELVLYIPEEVAEAPEVEPEETEEVEEENLEVELEETEEAVEEAPEVEPEETEEAEEESLEVEPEEAEEVEDNLSEYIPEDISYEDIEELESIDGIDEEVVEEEISEYIPEDITEKDIEELESIDGATVEDVYDAVVEENSVEDEFAEFVYITAEQTENGLSEVTSEEENNLTEESTEEEAYLTEEVPEEVDEEEPEEADEEAPEDADEEEPEEVDEEAPEETEEVAEELEEESRLDEEASDENLEEEADVESSNSNGMWEFQFVDTVSHSSNDDKFDEVVNSNISDSDTMFVEPTVVEQNKVNIVEIKRSYTPHEDSIDVENNAEYSEEDSNSEEIKDEENIPASHFSGQDFSGIMSIDDLILDEDYFGDSSFKTSNTEEVPEDETQTESDNQTGNAVEDVQEERKKSAEEILNEFAMLEFGEETDTEESEVPDEVEENVEESEVSDANEESVEEAVAYSETAEEIEENVETEEDVTSDEAAVEPEIIEEQTDENIKNNTAEEPAEKVDFKERIRQLYAMIDADENIPNDYVVGYASSKEENEDVEDSEKSETQDSKASETAEMPNSAESETKNIKESAYEPYDSGIQESAAETNDSYIQEPEGESYNSGIKDAADEQEYSDIQSAGDEEYTDGLRDSASDEQYSNAGDDGAYSEVNSDLKEAPPQKSDENQENNEARNDDEKFPDNGGSSFEADAKETKQKSQLYKKRPKSFIMSRSIPLSIPLGISCIAWFLICIAVTLGAAALGGIAACVGFFTVKNVFAIIGHNTLAGLSMIGSAVVELGLILLAVFIILVMIKKVFPFVFKRFKNTFRRLFMKKIEVSDEED